MSTLALRALLATYPRAWRARYGEELSTLIQQASGERGRLVIAADVLRAGLAERLRATGLAGDGLTPEDRTRGGLLRVLWAWVLFALGQIGVQKASEHWQSAMPADKRGLPTAAFDTMLAGAAFGSLLVLAGITLTAGPLRRFLAAGGFASVRRPILAALGVSVVVVAALVPLHHWATELTTPQRNGQDARYSAVLFLWALGFAAALAAWTFAASVTARRLELSRVLVAAETLLARGVSAAMIVMIAASAVWWGAIASSAPWFFSGGPAGSAGTVDPVNLVLPVVLMLAASLLGLGGARRARVIGPPAPPAPGTG